MSARLLFPEPANPLTSAPLTFTFPFGGFGVCPIPFTLAIIQPRPRRGGG